MSLFCLGHHITEEWRFNNFQFFWTDRSRSPLWLAVKTMGLIDFAFLSAASAASLLNREVTAYSLHLGL